jgi:hypothetical protein
VDLLDDFKKKQYTPTWNWAIEFLKGKLKRVCRKLARSRLTQSDRKEFKKYVDN